MPRPRQYTEPRANANVRLPTDLKRAVEEAAKEDGVSFNRWIEQALRRVLGWRRR